MRRCRWAIAVLVGLVTVQVWGGEDDWTHLGRDASRQSIAVDGPTKLLKDPNQGCWKADRDPCLPGIDIEFEGATGPVVCAGKVFAYAHYADPDGDTRSQLIAFDARSGEFRWAGIVDAAYTWGSNSTPCVDTKHNTVLIGSGRRVFALDATDGRPVWKAPTDLRSFAVNASICTALDLHYARAFLTDYSYESEDWQGRLYCINLDANEADNPFEPGQVVWDVPIGSASGNSASYADGRVYVASADGEIFAFDANATMRPNKPIWYAPDADWIAADPNIPIRGGFFGGVTVTREGFLYAVTYYFWEDENNSTLCKINIKNGRVVWTTAMERTDTIPVVVGDMIFVSGGSSGYGVPKVQMFHDLGDKVEPAWDTSVNLPDDVVRRVGTIGGWTAQPAYASGKLYVGGAGPSHDYSGAYDRLYTLDVTKHPKDGGFVLDYVDGCGNSPVVTHDSVYSVGPNALMKLHQPRALADINGDGQVTDIDRQALVSAMGTGYPLGTVRADLDLDGDVDETDLAILTAEWTAGLP
jgi:outer membrane protein assembly factor BamB